MKKNIIKTQNNILTDSGYKKIYSETSSDLVMREEENKTIESSMLDMESDIEDLFDNKAPIIHNHTTNDISDFPSSLPALDVYDWAKQPEKPHYTASEVDALPLDTTIPSKTSELINDSGFLTSIPEEYITATELSEKGYLTEHQDISDFARKDDLHTHENKTVLDIITDEKISEWNNKSNFSGNYSDLVGTPIIPSITGLATTEYVNNALTEEINRAITAESNHNTSITAHSDIRELISELTARLNALADSDDTTLDQLSEIIVYIKSNRTLIENVTTNKVNVSDIVDNLTSTSLDNPLSAKQGKVLNDLITALTSVVDTKIDVVNGDGIYIDTNKSGTAVTVNHRDVTRSNTSSTTLPSYGGTFTAVKSVTSDSKGHVTAVDTETVTLPTTSMTIDTTLSSTSTNPVQNKVINSVLSEKAPLSHTHLSTEVTMGDGNTAEVNLGAIQGITSSLASTGDNYALSASAGKNLQDQITTLNTKLSNYLIAVETSITYSLPAYGSANYSIVPLVPSGYKAVASFTIGTGNKYVNCYYVSNTTTYLGNTSSNTESSTAKFMTLCVRNF